MAFASLSGNLLGPIISSKLMEIGSPWTPLVVAFITTALAMSLIIFVPETLHLKKNTDEDAFQGPNFFSSLKLHLQHNFALLTESFSMLKSPPLALILLTYLIQAPIILAIGQFFVQYVSKRFGWSLSKTGYLLSMRGIVSIIVLLVALPGLSKLLLSPSFPFRFSASRKDLILAQFSALFLTLGSLLLAGPDISLVILGVVVITLGGGLAPVCRSLLTAFIDPQHTSRLYTLIGIVESVGSLYAGPALAWFFTTGMRLKGLWLGLPYFWLALVCALATIALCFVRSAAEPTEMPGAEEAGESDPGEEYEAGT
jgi:MFS transporter, PCFT/HCP family, solute carrier family 46 (folate transporter), member 1